MLLLMFVVSRMPREWRTSVWRTSVWIFRSLEGFLEEVRLRLLSRRGYWGVGGV